MESKNKTQSRLISVEEIDALKKEVHRSALKDIKEDIEKKWNLKLEDDMFLGEICNFNAQTHYLEAKLIDCNKFQTLNPLCKAYHIDIDKNIDCKNGELIAFRIYNIKEDNKGSRTFTINNGTQDVTKKPVIIKGQKLEDLKCLKKALINKKINEIEKAIEEIRSALQRKKAELHNLGYNDELDNDSKQIANAWNGDYKGLIDHIYKYLCNEKNLYYSKMVIKKFMSCLLSNQIIILAGKPGTGKTSLPSAIADAIGGECEIISVQPNWSDNQDLLGYYNVVAEQYYSTAFLDKLIEAKNHPEKIYFICLDEMNLAHVEYYFSSYLSAMEKSDKKLSLYSETQYKSVKENIHDDIKKYKELKQCQDNDKCVNAKYESDKLARQLNRVERYPANITIPDNVQIVGTLNMDETTKGLSPKVLDRSFVIEIGDHEKDSGSYYENSNCEMIYVKPEDFVKKFTIGKKISDDIETKLKTICNEINNYVDAGEILEVRFSARALKQISKLKCENDVNLKELIDSILEGKLLPSLIGENIQKNTSEKIVEYMDMDSNGFKNSSAKLEKMYDDVMKSFDFWR